MRTGIDNVDDIIFSLQSEVVERRACASSDSIDTSRDLFNVNVSK